jgi:hypothetical protein
VALAGAGCAGVLPEGPYFHLSYNCTTKWLPGINNTEAIVTNVDHRLLLFPFATTLEHAASMRALISLVLNDITILYEVIL